MPRLATFFTSLKKSGPFFIVWPAVIKGIFDAINKMATMYCLCFIAPSWGSVRMRCRRTEAQQMIDGLGENIKRENESKFSICKYFRLLHPAKERS